MSFVFTRFTNDWARVSFYSCRDWLNGRFATTFVNNNRHFSKICGSKKVVACLFGTRFQYVQRVHGNSTRWVSGTKGSSSSDCFVSRYSRFLCLRCSYIKVPPSSAFGETLVCVFAHTPRSRHVFVPKRVFVHILHCSLDEPHREFSRQIFSRLISASLTAISSYFRTGQYSS